MGIMNLMNPTMLNWFIPKGRSLNYKLRQVLQSKATLLQRGARIITML